MTRQVCISTDIGVDNIIVNNDKLFNVEGLNLSLFEINPVIQINIDKLEPLKARVEHVIDELFLNRKSAYKEIKDSLKDSWYGENRTMGEGKYYKKALDLNLRDSYDFNIGILLSLWELIVSCIFYKGSLYIYDRNLLSKYEGVSIIGFLRINKGKSKEEIKNGLIQLWAQLNINATINDSIMELGLKNLQQYGLISYNKEEDEYLLTARGLMFW